MVGRSGNSGERVRLDTASGRSLPDLMYGSDVLTWSNISMTWPPMTSMIACALPLYGTCSILTPTWRLKSSVTMCPVPPGPEVA